MHGIKACIAWGMCGKRVRGRGSMHGREACMLGGGGGMHGGGHVCMTGGVWQSGMHGRVQRECVQGGGRWGHVWWWQGYASKGGACQLASGQYASYWNAVLVRSENILVIFTARIAKRVKIMFSQACVTNSVQLGGGREVLQH